MSIPAFLVLADGSVFHGRSVGAAGHVTGEVVFDTTMTGYQEALVDGAHAGRILGFTYPQIGNTGCTQATSAAGMQAAGVVMREMSPIASSWQSREPLDAWLQRQGKVAVAGVDTRRLTRLLRDGGPQAGCLVAGEGLDVAAALALARSAAAA